MNDDTPDPLDIDPRVEAASVASAENAGLADDEQDLVGLTLGGKYELRRVIGEGGMGRIYLAHQEGMDRYVAVKVLNPGFAEDPRAVARFLREVKAASRLNHPNTIRIYDFGKVDRILFMVLEVLKGRSLANIIDGDGPLTTRRAVKVAIQICDSLAEAHQQGVIHRDLKPDNIHIEKMFGNPDHVKVLDFGIAKLQYGDRFAADYDGKTDPNLICGTPSYMSPEQIDGRGDIGPQTDVYGLGILIYEMLTGLPPFYADVPFDVLLMQLNEPPPPLPVTASVPEGLSRLIEQMLAKEAGARPADCQAVRKRLQAIAEQLDTSQQTVRSSADQTMLFGTNLSDALNGPKPKKRLVSGRRKAQTGSRERTPMPTGTRVARSTPVPGRDVIVATNAASPPPVEPQRPSAQDGSPSGGITHSTETTTALDRGQRTTPERMRIATPVPGAAKAAKSRRLNTGQMRPPKGLRVPTDPMSTRPEPMPPSSPRVTRSEGGDWGPDVRERSGMRAAGTTTKPFPPQLTTGDEAVAQLMEDISSDDVATKPRPSRGKQRPLARTPTSRRIEPPLRQTQPGPSRVTPKAAISLPMQPTRVALLEATTGEKFDLIATNELSGVLQCLGQEPAVGTRLALAGAETRFAHVEAQAEVEGPAPDVPGRGFLRIRWVSVQARARVAQMKLALDALLAVNPDAVSGWPDQEVLDGGKVLVYEPASGRLTSASLSQPEVSLAERSRRPSRVKQSVASPPGGEGGGDGA